ncbi:hypothetical protein GCM10027427_34760 [Pseudoclavibacter terrae]
MHGTGSVVEKLREAFGESTAPALRADELLVATTISATDAIDPPHTGGTDARANSVEIREHASLSASGTYGWAPAQPAVAGVADPPSEQLVSADHVSVTVVATFPPRRQGSTP